ncbi:MAG: NAD(P)(+) transhydrogenase (Re/Si-specific) subunit beta [Pirellulales bacterium]|nr:NAD(P)(+) transhydrogenase (Re/Si-specific) subunit beta [Pirellulales bacterium]
MNTPEIWINLAYLVAGVLFIFGLKGLTHPKTARRGNLLGATGMLVAVVATLCHTQVLSYTLIIVGMVIGAGVGAFLARWVQMTAMPQMVALFNGLGGAASALVAGAELLRDSMAPEGSAVQSLTVADLAPKSIAIGVSGLIGALTLTGSFIAFSKLQEIWFKKPFKLKFHYVINLGLTLVVILLGIALAMNPLGGVGNLCFWGIIIAAGALGVLLVAPIGGADMPVVIALLNSYSGLAAAATGFVLQNSVLIISGSLVGASGVILTTIMCKAMNRSLFNVLFGVMAADGEGPSDDIYEGKVKWTSPEEVGILFESAQRVVIVPGYGLAVAQAQHAVRELAQELKRRGAEVEYGIHPVAGRMPGHMNVLLAEADVEYDKLKDLDEINPTFPETDVVLVIGANDVVNPLARTDPQSPIAGMPILDVDKARTVVVIKRSLSPGYAGIANPLFAMDNTLMLKSDGKVAMVDILAAVRDV